MYINKPDTIHSPSTLPELKRKRMTISEKGIDLICQFEGFSAKPYPDPASKAEPYTIGYGTTIYPDGKKVTMQDKPVTMEQAKSFLKAHVDTQITPRLSSLLPNLKQNQFDALCSFAYNLGMGALESSTLLKLVKANGSNQEITANFNKWVNAGGKPLPGLVKRRSAEAKMFCEG